MEGHARRMTDEGELAQVRALEVEAWAGCERDRYLRLEPAQVTGRRIRAPR